MKSMFGTILEFLLNIFQTLKKKGKENWAFFTILIAVVVTVVFMQMNFEKRIEKNITETISVIEDAKLEEHKKGFANSIEMYYNIKNTLKSYRNKIGCEYILFIEYHNGAENIATGYQFCKFDVTISVCADTIPEIHAENYKNESLFSYDIFGNVNVSENRISSFKMDDLIKIDRHLYNQIKTATTVPITHVQSSHINYHGHRAGALVFLFTDSTYNELEQIQVANCASKIENLICSKKEEKKNIEE